MESVVLVALKVDSKALKVSMASKVLMDLMVSKVSVASTEKFKLHRD